MYGQKIKIVRHLSHVFNELYKKFIRIIQIYFVPLRFN
nr:MAG TPA: hypothetical protein [Caudoviricetes sp.]